MFWAARLSSFFPCPAFSFLPHCPMILASFFFLLFSFITCSTPFVSSSSPLQCSRPYFIVRPVHPKTYFCTLIIIWARQTCPRSRNERARATAMISVSLLHLHPSPHPSSSALTFRSILTHVHRFSSRCLHPSGSIFRHLRSLRLHPLTEPVRRIDINQPRPNLRLG